MSKAIFDHKPTLGPQQHTKAWYALHSEIITASMAAACLGESEWKQPLDMYQLLRGLTEPFAGNEYTERGKRFEPFIAQEYGHYTDQKVATGLPLHIHGNLKWLGASPDGRVAGKPRHGVEFKACNFRQAAKLGEEGSDEVFTEWLIQTQLQCLVCEFDIVDVFVMVELHKYRLFQVERNDKLIVALVDQLHEFWENVQAGIPPKIDPNHRSSDALLKAMYGVATGETTLSPVGVLRFQEREKLKQEISEREKEADALRVLLLEEMQYASIGNLPGTGYELTRRIAEDTHYTQEDIDKLQKIKAGDVKKKGGYPVLNKRKVKVKK